MATEQKILYYPQSIQQAGFQDDPGAPYVMFSINDTETATKLSGDVSVSDVFASPGSVGNGINQIGGAINGVVNTIGGAIGGLGDTIGGLLPGIPGIGNPLDDFINAISNNVSELTTTIDKNKDAPVRSLDTQQNANNKLTVKRRIKKLNKVIVMQMPNDLTVSQNVNYKEYDESLLSKIGTVAEAGNVSSAISAIVSSKKVSDILDRAPGTNAAQIFAVNRFAVNPRKELLFDSIDFRAPFVFTYTMSPRSEAEYRTIDEIITSFRYYSSPEIDPKNPFFYTFPAEFNIKFMFGSKENTAIPRIATCVLRRVNVNLSPKSQWQSLPSGFPPEIILSLEFQEIEIIDRTRIFKDFSGTGTPSNNSEGSSNATTGF